MQGELRLALILGQGHRHQRLERPVRHPVTRWLCRVAFLVRECVGEDDPLRRHDLAIDPPAPIVAALGPAHAEVSDAARADIRLAERRGEAVWSPPADEMLGFGPGLEDEAARRINDAGNNELALGRRRQDPSSYGHRSHPPFPFAARADSPPGGRGSASRSGDRPRASRRRP